MKRIIAMAVVSLVFACAVHPAWAKAPVPGRTATYVNDYAGVLDKDTKAELEKLVRSVKQKTPDKVEIIIAIFDNIDGWWFQDFAKKYGENWRAAKKFRRDNGVVMISVVKDGIVAMGVGKNLKEILHPTIVNSIVNNTILPDFKKKRFGPAMVKGAGELVAILDEADIPYFDWSAMVVPAGAGILIVGAIFLLILSRSTKKS